VSTRLFKFTDFAGRQLLVTYQGQGDAVPNLTLGTDESTERVVFNPAVAEDRAKLEELYQIIGEVLP
jgi:hypothetical protein